MDAHFLNYDQFRALARPTSQHLEEDIVANYISECEDTYIVPAITLELYYALCEYDEEHGALDDPLRILLNGGSYEDTQRCDGAYQWRMCYGFRKALSYFVYAKMMLDDGLTVTRSGNIQHNDEYGYRMEQKQRINRYNDVLNTAQMYLESCLQYVHFLAPREQHQIKQFGTRIKAIGD